MVTGKEGEESRIIGTSFEQEYGPVSQTYNILLFTHTTFMSDIKTNIYIILKGAVTDPRCYASLKRSPVGRSAISYLFKG